MTNLHLAILSTVLTLAILGALWLIHHRENKRAWVMWDKIEALGRKLESTERSLRSHVVDEIDNLEEQVHIRACGVHGRIERAEASVIDFITSHAEDLRKHAEDLRNHAKELSDRAEVQASPPREAVLRPRI